MTRPIRKPWSIVGAGPSGVMQAVVLAALFPDQEIYVLDKYREQVRGYGLQFQNQTSKMCGDVLNRVKSEITKMIRAGNLSAKDLQYYKTVLENIVKTKKFLNDNFTGFITAPFVRTHVISDLLREFAQQGLKNNNVKFLMHNEVTKEHLEALRDGTTPTHITEESAQTYECLEQSEFIFGADGAQSKVREVIFGEKNTDLVKDTMAHVIEVKLEMKGGAGRLDILKKSLYPTLINGHLHVWNHSKSGTATLHVFVEKDQYDLLKKQKYKGKSLGEFTNPYRRLIDLPEDLVEPIQKSITNIIGIGNFDENSLKITTLPISTYTARNLVAEVQGRSFALVGDAAVGLVLERGMNNGLYSTAEYGHALFQRIRAMRSGKQEPIVSSYTKFKALHEIALEIFLKNLNVDFSLDADTANTIRQKFAKRFELIMESDFKLIRDHQDFVVKQEMEFLKEVNRLLPKELSKKIILNPANLFEALKNKTYIEKNKKNDLDYCEDRIKSRADSVIKEIKFRFGFINFIKNMYGRMVSLYFNFKQKHFNSDYVSITDHPLKDKYEELKHHLPQYDIVDQREHYMKSAEWTFNMDRICLYLQDKIATFSRKSHPNDKQIKALHVVLDATQVYAEQIKDFINNNERDVKKMNRIIAEWEKQITQSHTLSPRLLVPAIRSSWKLTVNVVDLKTNVFKGFGTFLDNYVNRRYKHKMGIFGSSADLKVKSYEWLLNNSNIATNTKLCIIYSLLNDANNTELHNHVIKSFPDKAHVTLADVQDEILKIIKMDVPMAKSREFSSGLAEIGKCVAKNAFPTVTLTNKLDDVFAVATKPLSLQTKV